MNYRRIDSELIQRKLNRGEHLTFVDVGTLEQYHRAHVARAVHVPLEKIAQWGEAFLGSEATQIVVYGQNEEDPRGRVAAEQLSRLGFTGVHLLSGGLDLWLKQTLPWEGPLSAPGIRERTVA